MLGVDIVGAELDWVRVTGIGELKDASEGTGCSTIEKLGWGGGTGELRNMHTGAVAGAE